MGKAIALGLAINDPQISLNAGSEHPKHKLIGSDIGVMLGYDPINVHVSRQFENLF